MQFLSADQTRNKLFCLDKHYRSDFNPRNNLYRLFFLSAAQPQHPVSRFSTSQADRQATMPRPIEQDVHSAFMEFRNAGIFTLLSLRHPYRDPYQSRVVTSYIWYYSVTVPYLHTYNLSPMNKVQAGGLNEDQS